MGSHQFTEHTQSAIQLAGSLARKFKQTELSPAHVLLALFESKEEIVQKTLAKLNVRWDLARSEFEGVVENLPKVTGSNTEPTPSAAFHRYVDDALSLQRHPDFKDDFLSVEHLFLAGARTDQSALSKAYQNLGLNFEKVKKAVLDMRGNNRVVDANPEAKLGALEKYGRDLTQLARDNKLDPVIGRDDEVRRVIQILSRRTKNNPVLIGEPGVGKTAIAEGLALRIVRGDVPETLRDRTLWALDVSSLVAGAKYRGEFEERFKTVLKTVQDAAGQIILFIDEIHTIVKAGGSEGAMDAGNMLKPALARGELRCVGATTLDEYRIIEKDPALERRFQPVQVQPPSVEDTITILRGLKEKYEIHHKVRIKDAALIAAAKLSDRYIQDRFLPDKAIDLIDEASSRLKIQLESVPEVIDAAQRKITQMRIELVALSKETDVDAVKRRSLIEESLKEQEAVVVDLRNQWQGAKSNVNAVSDVKTRIEDLKNDMAKFERNADYAKASQIKFGELPQLEKKLSDMISKSDETLASQKSKEGTSQKGVSLKEEVDVDDVAAVVSIWTGIPVQKLFAAERERLLGLENELRKTVVGQEQALRAVSNAIRLSRSGLREAGKPLGSFLFLGPTGVGKTETAKTLAKFLFDSEKALLRFDMSEYMEEHASAKLIGSPPGYVGYEEGGQLTEAVRRQPYSIILFDEVEKAHPKVLNLMLQLLDDGRLTDSQGRTVSFQNCVVILTSNIGSVEILNHMGSDTSDCDLKALLQPQLLAHFRPELLNRLDEVVIFNPLGKEIIESIVKIQIQKLQARLAVQELKLECTEELVVALARIGFDPQYGARPLRRALQEQVEVPLSLALLEGRYSEGACIKAGWQDGKVSLN